MTILFTPIFFFLFLVLILILPCVGGLVTTTVQLPHLLNELNLSHIPASYPLFFLSFAEKNSSIFQFSTSVFIHWFLIQVGQILTKPQLDSAKNVRFYLVNLFNQDFRVMFGTASIPSIIPIRIDERTPASFVTCHVAWHGSCELRPRELVVKALWLDMLPCGFIHRQ